MPDPDDIDKVCGADVRLGKLQPTPNGAYLEILALENSDEPRKLPLDQRDVWKLGRSAKCSIELKDDTVSRNHAMIQRGENGEYYLIDLGSQNGSFVNNRRVSTPVALTNGDSISVGKSRIVFHDPAQGPGKKRSSISDFCSTRQIFAHRLVTVLVVDIRDYTVLTNAIDQSVLCQVIGGWFRDAERIMQKYGSAVQKYIGDAVMALWVHQTANRERREALQILQALREFQEATEQLNHQFNLPQRLRMGAGLNTGAAVVGSPGTGDLTAMGDSVNVAFRLEAATKDLRTDLIVGDVTHDYLKDLPGWAEYFSQSEVMLKGHETPVTIWATSFTQLAQFLGRSANNLLLR